MVEIDFQLDNCGSQSEFVEKAIRFYDGYVHANKTGAYLPRALSLSDFSDALEHAAVIFVAQLFGNLLQRVAAHTQFKDLHILFAERSFELIHQCLRYHCFLHILRRVRLLVFLSAVGVGIGLLKFLQ